MCQALLFTERSKVEVRENYFAFQTPRSCYYYLGTTTLKALSIDAGISQRQAITPRSSSRSRDNPATLTRACLSTRYCAEQLPPIYAPSLCINRSYAAALFVSLSGIMMLACFCRVSSLQPFFRRPICTSRDLAERYSMSSLGYTLSMLALSSLYGSRISLHTLVQR
jgi:hypothetical protein